MPRSPARLALTPRARADLDAIWAYSEKTWGIAQAEAYVRLIAQVAHDLAAGLVQGRSAGDVRPGYFRCPAGSHVLFYRHPEQGVIEVVRILHRRMDVTRHL